MSKCMTIDETIDQKDTFSEVTPKDIVGSVLEEILVSVLTVSDKGCNRIGDFNINEDFCRQYNQPLPVKDFEQANINKTCSTENLNSDKNKESPITFNENPAADWFGKTEEKVKPVDECKVISEEILAGNELQIQNGQIYLERVKSSLEFAREEYYKKEDVIKDEKIEIEYYNEGKLNKIYVPLNETSKESSSQSEDSVKCEDENKIEQGKENFKNGNEIPFKPFTTEELRQEWDSGNSLLVGKWDGDVANQREEVVKLLEGLSNIQVYSDGSADPNRPRACSVAEEDVKKMIKEIEEISFIQGHDVVEDYPPDGQGDADLESKSFTKSKDILNKAKTESRPLPEHSSDDMKRSQEKEMFSVEIRQDPHFASDSSVAKEPSIVSLPQTIPSPQASESFDGSLEASLDKNVSNENNPLDSNLQCEARFTERQITSEKVIVDEPSHKSTAGAEEVFDFSAAGSINLLESQEKIFARQTEAVNSRPVSKNDIFSEFTVPSYLGPEKLDMTGSLTFPSAVAKPDSSEELEEVQNLHSEVIKTPSDEMEEIIPTDNAADAVENNGACPSKNSLTKVISQGSNNFSQGRISSAESITQSKGSGTLQSMESSTSSESQTQEEGSGQSNSMKFNLHSKKMYSRMGYDPAGFQNNKLILSGSEEAFIESTESVLQVIEPGENGQDEELGSVSFSLLPEEINETSDKSSAPSEKRSECDVDGNLENPLSNEVPRENVYSGMTTIGPMKNVDYDPKDLTAPDIDFGKMTRITSSRQLAKDFNLLGAELSGTTTIKILEEIDSDESIPESDNDCPETVSLVNRDIASLTKVQKIREVMSYQPKLEEDLEDEESFPKPRLDLKDMESISDDRYKVPEVSIPLLSLEVTSEAVGTDTETEKQLIESMGLIISGLTEPYYENIEENNENKDNNSGVIEDWKVKPESPETKKEIQLDNEVEEDNEKDIDVVFNSSEAVRETESKYRTLSGVLKKASSKFMKKESDVLLRNSKSLPRDTSKILTSEGIRSILDECSTSASSVLKRSRSMLRNTQSLFKTISQNRMSNDSVLLEKYKISPSESDISSVERKLSFLKREDFAKAKNLIKSKMEKTFKRQENSPEAEIERMEFSEGKKELQVAIRNEEKLRVDRMENFKRWLPKSPLVYKSQFVKSQIKMKNKSPERDAGMKEGDDNDKNTRSVSKTTTDEEAVTIQEIPNEAETTLQQEGNEKAVVECAKEEDQVEIRIEAQPTYIVMETIEGLPTSDLESPSSEKENVETNEGPREYKRASDHQMNKSEAQVIKEKELEIEHSEKEEEKTASKMPSQRKMMAKKKKLSTRFRNFWCTAFGRVKTPPKKSDVS